jgi:D-3-phosphoglycerate dehydrogenase
VNFPEVELPRASPFRIICATSNQSNAGNQVADAVRAAGLTIAGMSSVSRGDLSYLIADLNAQPADDLMRAIGGRPGVLMARRI